MRYLVTARLKPEKRDDLIHAIDTEELGAGSIAGDEYLRNMAEARIGPGGKTQWVEVCYCETPLEEERCYWEEFFTLDRVQDAHARRRCRDLNGTEPRACSDCDCTEKLEQRLREKGTPFLECLRSAPLEEQ